MPAKTPTTQERIGRVGQRRQVVIPREMLKTLRLQEGDFVAFSEQANGVLIKPKRVVDPGDVLTTAERRAIDRGIAQSEKEYQANRSFGPFETHEAFIASLHRESAKLRTKKTKRPLK
jgi:bifunctional DNA-binding transcriptional regulator/antitoxin component of YhaV-PrlF toxin-antitoxin module